MVLFKDGDPVETLVGVQTRSSLAAAIERARLKTVFVPAEPTGSAGRTFSNRTSAVPIALANIVPIF